MASMVKYQQQAAAKARALTEYKGGEALRTATNAGLMVGAAFAAGVADGKMGEVMGVRPSTAGALVLGTIGIMTKSPKAIYAAAGLASPAAYEAGLNMSKTNEETEEETVEEEE